MLYYYYYYRKDYHSKVMNVSDKTCSQVFREIMYKEYPKLHERKSYAKFVEYLIFGTYRCKVTGKLIISEKILGQIEGVSKKVIESKNYSGQKFLKSFTAEVLPLTIYDYNYVDDLARTTEVSFPSHIQSAIIAEYQGKWRKEKKVYFVSGETYTEKTRKRERVKMKTLADSYISNNDYTAALLEYLNNLPPYRFTKLLDNLNEAYKALGDIDSTQSLKSQLALLRAIEDQSQPFYKPVEKTTRVFALNESLLGLKRNVRKAICKGWYEADLKAAQLAVVSTLWDIPYVTFMLTKTTGVWSYFLDYYNVDAQYKSILKEAVKEPLYACVYGMSKTNLLALARKNFNEIGIPDGGERFMESDLVETLLDARERMIKQIAKDKGVTDAFGTFISLKKGNYRSLLAQQAQSYELKLLWPIVDMARNTSDFAITAFQHDGVSLDFTRRADSWIERMQNAVKEQAELLNIPTELEITEL